MVVGASGFFGFKILVLGLLAAFFARNFAMSFNRLVDRRFDVQNPRTASRPSVDGRLRVEQIILFVVVNALGFIGVSYFINSLAFNLSFLFLIILGTYSFVKRFSYLAHLFLGLSLGLAPIAGSVAVCECVDLWVIFLSCGVIFWTAGFDLFYALDDQDFDRSKGLHSIPARFGTQKTLFIALVFHALTIIFWILFVLSTDLGIFGYIALVCSFLFLVYEHYLVHKDIGNIDKAFFATNGYLGIVFLFFIILDYICR